jgi:hypothetical protein
MSVPSAGVLYPSDLVAIQIKAEDIWANDPRMADYIPNAKSAQVILETQTAQFQALKDPNKDRTVQVAWLDQCDAEAEDCDGQCDIDGTIASTSTQNYDLTTCKKVGFKVPERLLRTNMFGMEDFVARQHLKMLKTLDEYWAVQVVSTIDANKGVNAYTGMYTVNGDTTEIPPSAWTPNLFGYFELVKQLNKITGAFLLTGQNLFLQDWQVKMNQANGEGKGAANMINTLRTEFDLFNLTSAGVGSSSFLVHPNALALITKSENIDFTAANPKMYQGKDIHQARYHVPSNTLQGVFYDVRYGLVCEGDEIYHVWQYQTIGDVLVNPAGCDTNRTGILGFDCVS